jgi:hypothetical protein
LARNSDSNVNLAFASEIRTTGAMVFIANTSDGVPLLNGTCGENRFLLIGNECHTRSGIF